MPRIVLFACCVLLFVVTDAPSAQAVSHCTPNLVNYDIVYVRAPRFGGGAVNQITVGAYDLESGLAPNTLSVTFNLPIGG